jgi:hypothetical protein
MIHKYLFQISFNLALQIAFESLSVAFALISVSPKVNSTSTWCEGVFEPFMTVNKSIKAGTKVKMEYHTIERRANNITVAIYVTEEEVIPKYGLGQVTFGKSTHQ